MTLFEIFLVAVPAVFAITVHEVAHGWTAYRLGDSTAADLGRLSLNPIKHIDPIGTVLVPGVLILLGGIFFGWAKPVPVNWQRLRSARRDIALVAAAGPGANLAMLVGWLILYAVLRASDASGGLPGALIYMSIAGIMFNATIMMLNLIPIPPLDGSRIVTAALPLNAARLYNRLEPFGMLILLAMIATGVLGLILSPGLDATRALMRVVG